MTRHRVAALLLAAAALGNAAAGGSTREARLKADVERLASGEWQGRRAGTEGGERAASWIGAEFQRIGLRPGAADGTYFQGFSFIDGVTLGPQNRLAVEPGRAFEPGHDFRPLAFSAAGVFEGDAVFAGYGIVAQDEGYDDYAGVDAKDRVVLVLRYGPGGDDPHSKWAAFTPLRLKAMAARERGARALFVVSGPLTAGAKDELVPLRADASLMDAGIPAFSVRRAVAEALFAGSGMSLEAAQRTLDGGHPGAMALSGMRVSGRADVTPRRSTTRNVVGVLPARGTAREALVVGAHYDHLGLGQSGSLDPAPDGKVHHGADDNASGVAALLELARALAPQAGTFTRSVLFVAFAAEELGALGSSQFVKEPPFPLERIAAMINMDMVGRMRDGKLDVHGMGTSPVWKTVVEQANRGAGLRLNLKEGGYGPSDHSPFYAAGKPVFFAFTGAHPDYHKPSDTAERVDAAGIARVLGLVEPVSVALATSPAPILFTRVAADKEDAGARARGFRVWVGGVPDYSHEGAGVAFSGVSPGSPAEQAGVQAGDVLVRFGPREIRNIYDYTYVLGEHKPGDRVEAVVRRAGQDVTLTLTLGSRPSAVR
jgi:hypothetical protein